MNPLLHNQQQSAPAMEHEETRRFLRQFCLIRYSSLIERINQRHPMDAETLKKLTDALVSIVWIDETLDEIKALPVP